MNKADALKKAIERKKEENDKNFEREVESLVWSIEHTSQKLRDLKKELTELTFEEIPIPDVSDCIEKV
jgi:peptidoglycan hydrolase CwlO-like protein